jgi:hypothetical protein
MVAAERWLWVREMVATEVVVGERDVAAMAVVWVR